MIPNVLGDSEIESVIPKGVVQTISSITKWIAENEKTARRFLKSANPEIKQSDLEFFILNKHTKLEQIDSFLAPLLAGEVMGLVSEAGLPCIADPGALIVERCHNRQIKVVPLTGPSSIILALISSGFSGQQFTFHGYLPIDRNDRKKRMRSLEQEMQKWGYTQIFMETPFRNEKLMDDLLINLNPSTRLCVACDISTPSEFISTMPVKQWKSSRPNLHKRPCIFAIGKI